MEYKRVKIADIERDDAYEIPEEKLVDISGLIEIRNIGRDQLMQMRMGGELMRKSIYLDEIYFDWVLGRDDSGLLVLVPIKREVEL